MLRMTSTLLAGHLDQDVGAGVAAAVRNRAAAGHLVQEAARQAAVDRTRQMMEQRKVAAAVAGCVAVWLCGRQTGAEAAPATAPSPRRLEPLPPLDHPSMKLCK